LSAIARLRLGNKPHKDAIDLNRPETSALPEAFHLVFAEYSILHARS